ncbi:MAG: hypothetical protein RQ731_08115 [Anaerosomatales bacterium]|nr:hypothetical protein [Anaerosomatales bacterium]
MAVNDQAAGTPPVGADEGTPSPTPDPPVPSPSDEYTPERFNGLMAARQDAERRAREAEENARTMEAELARSRREAESRQPVYPPASPDIARLEEGVEQTRRRTEAILGTVRSQAVVALLEKYPYADSSDVRGDTPDEWEASAAAAHQRIEKVVTERALPATQERVRRELEAEYGVPPSSGGESAPRGVVDDKLKGFRDSGDLHGLAKQVLLGD